MCFFRSASLVLSLPQMQQETFETGPRPVSWDFKCLLKDFSTVQVYSHNGQVSSSLLYLCLCNGFLLCLFFPVGVQPSAMWLAIWRSYASLFVVLKWHRGIVQEYCLGMVSAGSGSSGRCSVVRCLRSPPLVRHTKPHSPHSNPSPETLLVSITRLSSSESLFSSPRCLFTKLSSPSSNGDGDDFFRFI